MTIQTALTFNVTVIVMAPIIFALLFVETQRLFAWFWSTCALTSISIFAWVVFVTIHFTRKYW